MWVLQDCVDAVEKLGAGVLEPHSGGFEQLSGRSIVNMLLYFLQLRHFPVSLPTILHPYDPYHDLLTALLPNLPLLLQQILILHSIRIVPHPPLIQTLIPPHRNLLPFLPKLRLLPYHFILNHQFILTDLLLEVAEVAVEGEGLVGKGAEFLEGALRTWFTGEVREGMWCGGSGKTREMAVVGEGAGGFRGIFWLGILGGWVLDFWEVQFRVEEVVVAEVPGLGWSVCESVHRIARSGKQLLKIEEVKNSRY
jgi:hypothetical protein